VLGNGKTFQASTCSSANFDTKISVYRSDGLNSCGTCIVSEDDDPDEGTPSCPAAGAARVEWLALNGVQYFIGVSGAAGATGDFILTIVAGENCNDPLIPVQSINPSTFSHDTTNYDHEVTHAQSLVCPLVGTDPDFGNIGTSPDAFYSIIGTGENWEVRACNPGFDIQLAVSRHVGCSIGFCIQGNDDRVIAGCSAQSAALDFSTIAGSRYLIGVYGQSGSFGTYTLTFLRSAPLAGESTVAGSLAVEGDGLYAYEVQASSEKRVHDLNARSIVTLVKKITEPAKAQFFIYSGASILGQTDVFNLTVGYNAHNLTEVVVLVPGETYWIGYAVEFWDVQGTVELAAYFVGKSHKIAPGSYVAKLPSSLPPGTAIGKSATIYVLDSYS
jgi:hypothetical protein